MSLTFRRRGTNDDDEIPKFPENNEARMTNSQLHGKHSTKRLESPLRVSSARFSVFLSQTETR